MLRLGLYPEPQQPVSELPPALHDHVRGSHNLAQKLTRAAPQTCIAQNEQCRVLHPQPLMSSPNTEPKRLKHLLSTSWQAELGLVYRKASSATAIMPPCEHTSQFRESTLPVPGPEVTTAASSKHHSAHRYGGGFRQLLHAGRRHKPGEPLFRSFKYSTWLPRLCTLAISVPTASSKSASAGSLTCGGPQATAGGLSSKPPLPRNRAPMGTLSHFSTRPGRRCASSCGSKASSECTHISAFCWFCCGSVAGGGVGGAITPPAKPQPFPHSASPRASSPTHTPQPGNLNHHPNSASPKPSTLTHTL